MLQYFLTIGITTCYKKYVICCYAYRVAQKTGTFCFVHLNFVRYWPIL